MKLVSLKSFTLAFSPGLIALVAAILVIAAAGGDAAVMTRDVTLIGKLHPLAGGLSQLGLMVWAAAASICLFSVYALRDEKTSNVRRFLFFSGLLSLYLLMDDAFRFHEDLAQDYLHISQHAVYAVLGVAVGTYLLAFRQVILQTNFLLLLLALAFLGGSEFSDLFLENVLAQQMGRWSSIVEDGLKWLGIWTWCLYFASASAQLIRSPQDSGTF